MPCGMYAFMVTDKDFITDERQYKLLGKIFLINKLYLESNKQMKYYPKILLIGIVHYKCRNLRIYFTMLSDK